MFEFWLAEAVQYCSLLVLCPTLVHAFTHVRYRSPVQLCARMVCITASHFRYIPLRIRRWFHPSSKPTETELWLFGVVHANNLRACVVADHRIGGTALSMPKVYRTPGCKAVFSDRKGRLGKELLSFLGA